MNIIESLNYIEKNKDVHKINKQFAKAIGIIALDFAQRMHKLNIFSITIQERIIELKMIYWGKNKIHYYLTIGNSGNLIEARQSDNLSSQLRCYSFKDIPLRLPDSYEIFIFSYITKELNKELSNENINISRFFKPFYPTTNSFLRKIFKPTYFKERRKHS